MRSYIGVFKNIVYFPNSVCNQAVVCIITAEAPPGEYYEIAGVAHKLMYFKVPCSGRGLGLNDGVTLSFMAECFCCRHMSYASSTLSTMMQRLSE